MATYSDPHSPPTSAPSAAPARSAACAARASCPASSTAAAGDSTSFKVDARALRQVLVDGSALIDLEVAGKTLPGDRQGPAAPPGARRGDPHRPARGPPRREDPDQVGVHLEGVEEAPGVKEGGVLEQVTHQLNIEALPTAIPEAIVRRRERHGDRRHHAPLRGHRARGRDLPRRPRGDDHRDGRRPDRGRGARRSRRRPSWSARRARARRRRGRGGRRRGRRGRGSRGARSPEPLPPPSAAAGRSIGSSSAWATPATATPAPATTSASRWPRWPPSAGACRARRSATAASTPTAAPAPAARASRCCCRRPT